MLLEEPERSSGRAVNGRRCSPPAVYLASRAACDGCVQVVQVQVHVVRVQVAVQVQVAV